MLTLVVYYLLFVALLCEVSELALHLSQTLVVLYNNCLCDVNQLVESAKRVSLLTIVGMIFLSLT